MSFVRRSTLFVRKSTLIVRKCLEVRQTLRIRVISSRRRAFNVSFLRFSEAICCVERPSAQSAECKKKIARECFCLIGFEELSSKKAENDVVVFFLLSSSLVKPFVALNCYH